MKIKYLLVYILITITLLVCGCNKANNNKKINNNNIKSNISKECIDHMCIARNNHSATLLKDGRVVIIGGDTEESSKTAEIYNPETNTSVLVEEHSSVPHSGHDAFLLKNGTVLIIDNTGIEIFDPTTEKFTLVSKMITPRVKSAVLMLPDEKILIIGGRESSNPLEEKPDQEGLSFLSIEQFDPKTFQVSEAKFNIDDSLLKDNQSTTLMKNKILFISNPKALTLNKNLVLILADNRAYMYNLTTNKIEIINNQIITNSKNDTLYGVESAIKLSNDTVVMLMKDYSSCNNDYFIYRLKLLNNLSEVQNTYKNENLFYQKFYPLTNGKLLIWGKHNNSTSKLDLYDPKTNKFIEKNIKKTQRGGTPVELKSGNLLITGGQSINFLTIGSNRINIVEI